MSLLSKIKEDQINARKNKDKFLAQTLTTIIGEAEKIGKDDGNRETTDAETVKVMKKFRNGVTETIKLMSENNKLKNNNTTTQDEELRIVDQYIPAQLTENQLTTILLDHQADVEDTLKLPTAMKFLNQNYAGLYNGRLASMVIRDIIDNGVR